MRYSEFEHIMSEARMSRYLAACGGDSKKAMTLYRLNLKVSQELFTVISCFEVAMRNAINGHCVSRLGNDWLLDAVSSGGCFDHRNCRVTMQSINDALRKLNHDYTHNKLVAELGFGFWRYMFAQHQFAAAGRSLLMIFPAKPTSTPAIQYNHTYVFNQMAHVNDLRNRIAHHEPVCFQPRLQRISTTYVRQHYAMILQLFQWMSIDESALLYGLDHINVVADRIDGL